MIREFYVPNVNGCTILESALEYLRHGLSIVPTSKSGKNPLVPWIKYQTELPTEELILQWFREGGQYENQNLGIITGGLSNLSVIDIDDDEAKDELKRHLGDDIPQPDENPIIRTPRGWHIYYPYSPDIPTGTGVWGIKNLDGRSEGGLVVAPPSKNLEGESYIRYEREKNG